MSQIKTLTIVIKAGEIQDLAVQGNIIGLIEANTSIKFMSDENGGDFTLEKGQEAVYLNNEIFYNFKVSHKEVTDQSITVAVGRNAHIVQTKSTSDVNIKGSVPLVVSGVTLTASNVGISSPNVLTSPADVSLGAATGGILIGAAAGGIFTREVVIKNLTNNTAAFRIGTVGTDATHGHELQAGESITLTTRAAIYGYNFGAGAQSVSILVNEL